MKRISNIEVSIIIINYNTFQMTYDCIASIIKFTKNVSYEIILVDNGSTECDADLFVSSFPSVLLIKSKENLGFSRGNNVGIAHANGETVLLLNSDVQLIEDSISMCYDRFIDDKDIGVITCKLVYPDLTIQKQCHRLPSIRLSLIELFRIHKLWSAKKRALTLFNGYFSHDEEVYAERIWGTFFMFKKNLLKHFPENKLSETFFMYGEDTEWCYIITKKIKKRILYFPNTFLIHKLGASNFANKYSIIKNNRLVFLQKYYGKTFTLLYQFINLF